MQAVATAVDMQAHCLVENRTLLTTFSWSIHLGPTIGRAEFFPPAMPIL